MSQRHMESRFEKKQYPSNVAKNACSLTWKGCNYLQCYNDSWSLHPKKTIHTML